MLKRLPTVVGAFLVICGCCLLYAYNTGLNEEESDVSETEAVETEVCKEEDTNSISGDEDVFESLSEYYGERFTSFTDTALTDNRLYEAICSAIEYESGIYPYATFGVGVYDIYNDWNVMAEYNADQTIWSGCQVKNSFVCYALKQCDDQDIDIYTTYVGGVSLYDLFFDTLYWSNYYNDNANYIMLVDYFDADGYRYYQKMIGGQYVDRNILYGSSSVHHKLAEWKVAYNYMNNGSENGYVLASLNNNSNFSYIAQGMNNYHSYNHKSGWCSDPGYLCCGDSAIIDGRWFVSIQSMNANVSSVRNIAAAIEPFLS